VIVTDSANAFAQLLAIIAPDTLAFPTPAELKQRAAATGDQPFMDWVDEFRRFPANGELPPHDSGISRELFTAMACAATNGLFVIKESVPRLATFESGVKIYFTKSKADSTVIRLPLLAATDRNSLVLYSNAAITAAFRASLNFLREHRGANPRPLLPVPPARECGHAGPDHAEVARRQRQRAMNRASMTVSLGSWGWSNACHCNPPPPPPPPGRCRGRMQVATVVRMLW